MRKFRLILALSGFVFSNTLIHSTAHCSAISHVKSSPLQQKVEEALKMPHRTEKDIKRDHNRSPLQALTFFGLEDNMKVIEVIPGGGWYTKILAPVLKDRGQLYIASKAKWLTDLDPLLAKPPFSQVKKLPITLEWNRAAFRYSLRNVDFGMTDADMVLNIREYHNFAADDKVRLNNASFKALKSGGIYVVVDHTRRHMEPETYQLNRREDPVRVILEVQAAGFRLLDSSNIFFRPHDKLTSEVGRKSVTGKTDRFALVFKKP